jgi:hypothetical protein
MIYASPIHEFDLWEKVCSEQCAPRPASPESYHRRMARYCEVLDNLDVNELSQSVIDECGACGFERKDQA